MSSTRKVGASDAPQGEYNKYGYCENAVVKVCVICTKCTKVCHRSCSGKAKKCCEEEILSPSINEQNDGDNITDAENSPRILEVTSEFTY
ncbi:hypothetical protein WA026_008438 [Henosepilachna vigintioctopunctata]|uniref:Phorbol-ester/DAG-type domain-containing protein n=1 Tax=Henosepilachna vigintioctopunctata TaxID=420089 RepID=A0AAW1UFV6_9CUCU